MGVSAKNVSLPVSNLSIATSAQSVIEVYLRKGRLATSLGAVGVRRMTLIEVMAGMGE
jgi:hypothetical protein